MKKNILKNICTFLIILVCILWSNTVFAAGNFTVSKTTTTITEGKTDSFSINGKTAVGRVDITSSNTEVATVSTSNAWLENSSTSVTVTGKKAGNATITIKGTVSDANGEEATISKTIAVTVKAKTTSTNTNTNTNSNTNTTTTNTGSNTNTTTTKSSNANLKTLGVTPKEYDFTGFKKDKTSYSVTIPSNVNTLKVLYKTEDSKAKVKVTGNSGFETGSNNEIKVVVTAEDGKTTKTYIIKVTKLATEEEKPGNVIDDEKGLYLETLEIEGLELTPAFEKDVFSYQVTLKDKDKNYVTVHAEANQEKADIEISGNYNLQEGDNTINIVVTLEGSVEQKVYQIILTKESPEETAISENDKVEETKESTESAGVLGSLKKYLGMIIGVIVFIIIAVIALIIKLKRDNDRLEQEEDEIEPTPEKASQEYNVFQDNDEMKEEEKEKEIETEKEIKEQTQEIFKKKGKHF